MLNHELRDYFKLRKAELINLLQQQHLWDDNSLANINVPILKPKPAPPPQPTALKNKFSEWAEKFKKKIKTLCKREKPKICFMNVMTIRLITFHLNQKLQSHYLKNSRTKPKVCIKSKKHSKLGKMNVFWKKFRLNAPFKEDNSKNCARMWYGKDRHPYWQCSNYTCNILF